MATNLWRGDAAAVAQVVSLTPASPIPGDKFSVTINGKTVSYTTTAATTSDVVQGLSSALQASTIAEFLEISWYNNSNSYVQAAATTAGVPFTLSASVTPASLAVPVIAGISGSTGGSLVSGTTYYYKMTATNAAGETTPSAQFSYTPSGSNLVANLSWTTVPGATGYKIYRSTTSGTFGASSLLTTLIYGSSVGYQDTGTSTSTGTPPSSNTAVSPVTLTAATVTASAGPNDVSVASNWSTASLPASGDTLILDGSISSSSLLYGLSSLSSITLANLNIYGTFTGTVGLPDRNTLGYYEYRQKFLQIGASSVSIGANGGNGSGRIRLNLGTVQTAISCYSTANSLDTGLPALQILATNSANTLYAYQGTIGLAFQAGQTSTFATVNINYASNPATDVNLFGGAGLTLTTLNMFAGNATLQAGATTITANNGICFVLGSGSVTTATLDGGTLEWYSSGTITNLNIGPSGTADFSLDSRPKTVTNCTLFKGCTLTDPNKVVTFTNGISLNQCRFGEVTVDLGENRTFALTA